MNRHEYQPPEVTGARGWRYHHLGIPTRIPRENERYLEDHKFYISGFESSPFGIEWMRFESDCTLHELIQTVPHIAFQVDDLEEAVAEFELLGPITSPMEGVRVAMIVHDGAPVELLEIKYP